jgi:hypothetical protein
LWNRKRYIKFLRQYLEAKFTEGMSWENQGHGNADKGMKEWQFDHIYPCASFNLKNLEEQQVCFHWSNFQPIWAKLNKYKRDKII